MLSNMFSNIDKLNSGLDASWKRNEVIVNNIANVDTPGFKRSTVEFEDYFKKALEDDDSFKLRRTRSTHMDIGTDSEVEPVVVQDTSTSMRMDENNVDIDTEMSELATNVVYYETLLKKVSSEISQLSIAIKGN